LRIHTGRISEIFAGDVKVKAAMKFGDLLTFEKAFAPISISGFAGVGSAASRVITCDFPAIGRLDR
jgi:hypothetical protein